MMSVAVTLTNNVPWIFIVHIFAMHAVTAVALIITAAEIRSRDGKAADYVSRIGFYILASVLGGAVGIALGVITS